MHSRGKCLSLLDEFIVADCIRGGHTGAQTVSREYKRIYIHIYIYASANRFETRHQEAGRQVRCSLQHAARVHDFTGRQLAPRFVCVLSTRNKYDSDTENVDCRRFERHGGAYGSFRARFGTILDDRFSFSLLLPSLRSFPTLFPLPFLASVGQPCALKSAISAGSIPDIWFRGRPISCVYGNLSPALPSLLDFIPILFQLDALKTFRTLSRLYTGVR